MNQTIHRVRSEKSMHAGIYAIAFVLLMGVPFDNVSADEISTRSIQQKVGTFEVAEAEGQLFGSLEGQCIQNKMDSYCQEHAVNPDGPVRYNATTNTCYDRNGFVHVSPLNVGTPGQADLGYRNEVTALCQRMLAEFLFTIGIKTAVPN